MKRLTREEAAVERLLRATRSVAVIGASARRGDPTEAVVEYLKHAGFDVFPVRHDRADVAGLRSWARLSEISGSIDLLLVLDGVVDAGMIEEAAAKDVRALWLAPGVPSTGLAQEAELRALRVVEHRDIVAEHRHTEQSAGQPAKRGVNVGARRRDVKESAPSGSGYTPRGGGGAKGGGGGRAVLDEKKMVAAKPRAKRR